MKVCPNCNLRTEEDICPECHIRTIDTTKYIAEKRDPDRLIGKTLLDRYQVTRLIGVGGMGNVYEAQHTVFEKRFAIKVIKKSLVDNLEAVKRFQREAFLASKLDHPNIVKVHDFGTLDSGQQFILMEFVDGESLRMVLKRNGPMSGLRAATIVLQVAKALDYAHSKGVIHRDLKPDNIFIRTIRGEDFAKVLDFGVAKLLVAEDGESLTKEGLVPGTPEYMSPEQVLGKSEVDAKSDIYSLGLVFYEMLTGIRPFKMETPMASAVAHLKMPAPPIPENIRKGLPEGIVSLISDMVERNWRKRPQNASEVVKRIKTVRFQVAKGSDGISGEVLVEQAVFTPTATSRIMRLDAPQTIGAKDLPETLEQTRVIPDESKKNNTVAWWLVGLLTIVSATTLWLYFKNLSDIRPQKTAVVLTSTNNKVKPSSKVRFVDQYQPVKSKRRSLVAIKSAPHRTIRVKSGKLQMGKRINRKKTAQKKQKRTRSAVDIQMW